MKKERQIGIRVGLPTFFILELEDVYRHTEGAHRALAFPDFVGLLVGMGLEQYRKGINLINTPGGKDEQPEEDTIHLFDMNPHDLIREYDEQTDPPGHIRFVHTGELV